MVDIAGPELSPEDVEVLQHPLVGSVLLEIADLEEVVPKRRRADGHGLWPIPTFW